MNIPMRADAILKRFKHHDALKTHVLDNINSAPAVLVVEGDEMSFRTMTGNLDRMTHDPGLRSYNHTCRNISINVPEPKN